jgi:hypothetical protein
MTDTTTREPGDAATPLRLPGEPVAGRTVYLDAGALVAPVPGDDRPRRLQPDARAALRHLGDGGHDVVLTGAAGEVGAVLAALRDLAPSARATLPVDAAGWLVTGDPAACAAARDVRGVRTILVGPAVTGRGLAHRPADVEARGLLDAVLVILASEAMPDAVARPVG